MNRFNYGDCYAKWNDKELIFGNAGFCRTVNFEQGFFHTVSLKDGSGREYAAENKTLIDCFLYDSYAEWPQFRSWKVVSITASAQENLPFEGNHLLVSVRMIEKYSRTQLVREFFLYPGLPAFGLRNRITFRVFPAGFTNARPELAQEYGRVFTDGPAPVVDTLHPASGFKVRKTVEFAGHTDVQDTPVREHIIKNEKELTGNLLYCEDRKGSGFLCLQEAPPSTERREYNRFDFCLTTQGDLRSCCWGVVPVEFKLDQEYVSYRNMIGLYQTADDAAWLLKRYLKTRYNYGALRRGIVANAWGCGKFPQLVSTQFLKDEVAAAAECGADYYQVDDHWQCGLLQDLLTKNMAIELREFWAVSPERLENGSFDSLCQVAKKSGIELALWMAPSSTVGYTDYKEFAGLILDFHRRYNFRLFKIDGAYFSSYDAEKRFEEMLRIVREKSGKEVFFNLDVTAGMRGGFFMLLDLGNLFLENRYVFQGLGYHPERTLRSVWHLAHYIRLQTLQIEVPNPGDIKKEFYEKKKESCPDVYPWDYWMAVAFMGNPLLWFSPSCVPAERRKECKRMMELHKKYRDQIFADEIFPVGAVPDSKSLTGLVAKKADGTPEFLALYREKDAKDSAFAIEGKWELIAGDAKIRKNCVELGKAPCYAILKKYEMRSR